MADRRRVAVGSDHAGVSLKRVLVEVLEGCACDVDDLGTHDDASCDYATFGHAVAAAVAEGRAQIGLLVCGTGVGMSMAANRHRGVRAVVCSEAFSARMSRRHNDANVLCIGARVVGVGVAVDILEAFLSADFEQGRHARRLGMIELDGP